MTLRLSIILFFIVATLLPAMPNTPLYAREGAVKVGVYNNAPIVFKDEEGNLRGFSVEVLEYIASKENWDLEYVFGTWPESLARLEKGQIDIQVYIAYSEERAKKYDFTNELLFSDWGVIYARPGSGIETLIDLEGKTVNTLRNGIHGIAFKKLVKDFGIRLNIIDVDMHHSGFRFVEERESDAVVVNRIFGLANAKNYKTEKTNIIFNPIEIRYAMLKGKNRDLGIAIDKHMKLLKADKDSIYYKSFNKSFDLEEAFVPDWVEWLLAAGVGLVCLLFGISILLRGQVKKRTRELESEIVERKASEERMRSVLETSPVGISIYDETGQCIIANDSLAEMIGAAKEQVLQQNYSEIESWKISGMLSKAKSAVKENITKRYEFVGESTFGQTLHLDCYLVPFSSGRLLFMAHDISERILAEEELEKHREHLEEMVEERTKELEEVNARLIEASRLKSRFLSTMSHELRTPLNSVIALSSVLRMTAAQKIAAEEVEYLDVIHRNGKRLLVLINDILDLSKIEAGHMDVVSSFFSLKTTIENVLDCLQPLAEKKELSLRMEIAPGPSKVQSDEKRVHQILLNLVSNAIKFTEKGEVAVLIDSGDDRICVKVTDSGIGIAEKDLSSIFEEFTQVDDSTSRRHEGAGLGLAIAYKATRNLGGDLSVESRPGQGATFTLSLPVTWQGPTKQMDALYSIESNEMIEERKTVLVEDDEPEAVDLEMPDEKLKTAGVVAGKAEKTEKPGITAEAPPRILVIEDNPDNLLSIRAVLKDRYTIIEATDGEKGLKAVLPDPPDLILLDISLPGMDGYAVVKEIKGDEKANRTPVIALTAHAMKGDREKAVSAGCNDYLSKPVDPVEILETIEKWLEKT